jgi:hypothetical protein
MTPFSLGYLVGSVVTPLAWIVGRFLVRELSYRRGRPALRSLTSEARDESRRFARAVGASVQTPVPFKRLRTKGVA